MIYALRLAAVVCLAGALWAEEQPQLRWEGEVEGSAVIYIRGKKLRLEDRGQGEPVRHASYKFFEQLPESNQAVSVKPVLGRGEVRILEQPSLENKYTLAVSITDRQEGTSFYSLEFYWRPGVDGPRDPFNKRKKLPAGGFTPALGWSGIVEGTVRVTVQGREASARSASGSAVSGGEIRVLSDFSAAKAPIELRKRQGRGRVDVIELPTRNNGGRLVFEIVDPGPWPERYEVEAGW